MVGVDHEDDDEENENEPLPGMTLHAISMWGCVNFVVGMGF